jgi:23S rRNA pseudouridine2605 synthase/16S rRNA pseudouridine516 synthase
MERLHRFLARCGISSRRRCEDLIKAGLVKVNGCVVRNLGGKIDPQKDVVEVDGKVLRRERQVYILLYKPRGYVTTLSDPKAGPSIAELIKGVKERVYPAGRLDKDSEGLLFLTNDGEVAYRISHPRYGFKKHYIVKIKGNLSQSQKQKILDGIVIDNVLCRAVRLQLLEKKSDIQKLKIVLEGGRKRQIRLMFQACGCKVLELKREAIGPFQLGSLRPGEYRYLDPAEVGIIKQGQKT